jgi:hypothetical protein
VLNRTVPFCLLLLAASAASALAAPPQFTGDFINADLADVLARAQEVTGVVIRCPKELADKAAPVNVGGRDILLDRFLYKVLRPNGLEAVWRSEKSIEVVRQATLTGMTKTFGRAVCTLSRLEARLEKAVQQGDEAQVPAWTVEDDRALAVAIADALSGVRFVSDNRPPGPATGFSTQHLMELLSSWDREVRIGSTMPVLLEAYRRDKDFDAYVVHELGDALVAMAKDPDPQVRAAGVFLTCCGQLRVQAMPPHIAYAALRDPSREVRLALALGPVVNREVIGRVTGFDSLMKDEDAMVRVAATLGWLQHQRRAGDLPASADAVRRILGDANPVARAAGLFLAGWTGSAEERGGLLQLVAERDDPWLELAAKAVMPLAEGGALDTTGAAALLESAKPSHQLLGATTVIVGRILNRAPRNDDADHAGLDRLDALAQSDRFWPRVAAITMSRALAGGNAEARLAAALRSGEETDRLAALLACAAPSGRAIQPVLLEDLRCSLARPLYAEKALAAEGLCRAQTVEDSLSLLRTEVAKDPHGATAKAVLSAVSRMHVAPAELGANDPQADDDAAMKALEVVLATKDPDLELLFVQARPWFKFTPAGGGNATPFLRRILAAGQPHTVHAVVTGRLLAREPLPAEVLDEVRRRLATDFGGNDPKVRRFACDSVSAVLARRAWFSPKDAATVAAYTGLAAAMMRSCFQGGEEEVGGAFALLDGLLARPVKWKELPAEIPECAVSGLSYSAHKVHGREAAELLAALYWTAQPAQMGWNEHISAKNMPALWQAMEQARIRIMEAGTPEEQVMALCGLARGWVKGGDGKHPCEELQRRFVAGTVPPSLQIQAALAIEGGDFPAVLPEFTRFALPHAFDLTRDYGFRFAFGRILESAVRRYRVDGVAQPPWVEEFTQTAWTSAHDPAREESEREEALWLFMATSGTRSKQAILDAIRDPKGGADFRGLAAKTLPRTDPATILYQEFLPQYDTLPPALRRGLLHVARECTEAPGMEAFAVRCLTDDAIPSMERAMALGNIQFTDTPALRAALDELGNDDDPQLRQAADGVLQRFDGIPRSDAPPPKRPSAADFQRELATLANVTWNKQDTIQKNLTWFGGENGLALADSQNRQVQRFHELLGENGLVPSAIAFGPDKVWLGTNKGLFAYDRAGRFWARFAVGGKMVDAAVKELALSAEGVLTVTIEEAGQAGRRYDYDTAKGKWGGQ